MTQKYQNRSKIDPQMAQSSKKLQFGSVLVLTQKTQKKHDVYSEKGPTGMGSLRISAARARVWVKNAKKHYFYSEKSTTIKPQ